MLTWHGAYDELMPLAGTRAYYDAVLARDPQAGEYFRLFEAPGMGHCYNSEGCFPGDIIDVMIEWVEGGGPPPERLYAENRYAVGGDEAGSRAARRTLRVSGQVDICRGRAGEDGVMDVRVGGGDAFGNADI